MHHNKNGLTWKEHVRPFLKTALLTASKKWIVPKVKEQLCKRLGVCVEKRDNLNDEIRKLRDQGATIINKIRGK